jgi:hypothetical protein
MATAKRVFALDVRAILLVVTWRGDQALLAPMSG